MHVLRCKIIPLREMAELVIVASEDGAAEKS